MNKRSHTLEVLIVDNEQKVLDGLRRQFRANRSSISLRFAVSGGEAIKLLREKPADVIVSDMHMPGMSGTQLLKHVREKWPNTVRFILSGQADQADLLSDIGVIHQYLQKPCEPSEILGAISRAFEITLAVESGQLREIVSSIVSLPIVTENYLKLVEFLNDSESELDDIVKLIELDVGISTKVLQLVNSSFFGLPRKSVSVRDAVMLIGRKSLLCIVVSARIFEACSGTAEDQSAISELWSSSTALGNMAAMLATSAGVKSEQLNTVKLSGMLSHIGRAVLLCSLPDDYKQVIEKVLGDQSTFREAEFEMFGVSQSTIGAYALGIWGFSDQIVEAVAYQSQPSQSQVADRNHPLFWLHLAKSIYAGLSLVEKVSLDLDWLRTIGISEDQVQGYRSVA